MFFNTGKTRMLVGIRAEFGVKKLSMSVLEYFLLQTPHEVDLCQTKTPQTF